MGSHGGIRSGEGCATLAGCMAGDTCHTLLCDPAQPSSRSPANPNEAEEDERQGEGAGDDDAQPGGAHAVQHGAAHVALERGIDLPGALGQQAPRSGMEELSAFQARHPRACRRWAGSAAAGQAGRELRHAMLSLLMLQQSSDNMACVPPGCRQQGTFQACPCRRRLTGWKVSYDRAATSASTLPFTSSSLLLTVSRLPLMDARATLLETAVCRTNTRDLRSELRWRWVRR